jgi:hypothetical protein
VDAHVLICLHLAAQLASLKVDVRSTPDQHEGWQIGPYVHEP